MEPYKRRIQIKRDVDRIERLRRVFTRYDETDLSLSALIIFAFITGLPHNVNTT